MCVYGLFTNLWYFGSIAIYFLVYGDNSSTFGLYPIIPSAMASLVIVWIVRNMNRTLNVLALLTAPFSLHFTYNAIRYGLF